MTDLFDITPADAVYYEVDVLRAVLQRAIEERDNWREAFYSLQRQMDQNNYRETK